MCTGNKAISQATRAIYSKQDIYIYIKSPAWKELGGRGSRGGRHSRRVVPMSLCKDSWHYRHWKIDGQSQLSGPLGMWTSGVGISLPRHFGAKPQRSEQMRLELVAIRNHGSLAKDSDTKRCLGKWIWWQIVFRTPFWDLITGKKLC